MQTWRAKDLTGQRFGHLVVVGRAPNKDATPRVVWFCDCDCGRRIEVRGATLRAGQFGCRSCSVRTHGHSVGRPSPEYVSWHSMKTRCYNPKHIKYASYGGRGISVCKAWRDDFSAFLRDVGPRPADHELDRIDPDGDYEPGNVRWVTHAENMKNLRAHN